jgi:oxygen-dependent protoporphyrinogen oxidase
MFEGRSPPGVALATAFAGGQRDPALAGLPDGEIARITLEELADLIGAAGPARLCAVTRWPRAIPQYTLGHLERIARAQAAEAALPGLFLCASYRGGVSVGDCIKAAHACADAVAAFIDRSLRTRSPACR